MKAESHRFRSATAPDATEAASTALPKSFADLIASSPAPVLVDFWAPWCGPCTALAPTVARLARRYTGRLRTVKVNVDERPHIAATYDVRSIPTLALFRRGRIVMRLTGARSFEELARELDAHLHDGG